jgi:DnaK suppressor protein
MLLMTRANTSSTLKARAREGKMTRLCTAELHALEAQLRARADELASALRGAPQQALAPGDSAQPHYFRQMDAATAGSPSAHEFTALSRQAQELRAIQHALQRIAQGNYGRCRRCGGEIPHPRLFAQPAAELCLACQVESEQHYSLAPNRQ